MSERLELIARELKKIQDEYPDESLQPRRVVELAAAEDHPLHSFFEWDDQIAGYQYRLDQARQLIHSVEIRVTFEDRIIHAPYYVRDPRVEHDEQGYAPVELFKNKQQMALLVLQREVARVESALERALGAAIALGIEKEFRRATKHVVPQLQRLTASNAATDMTS